MAFNVKKYNVVSITNDKKNRQKYSYEYEMDGLLVKTIESTPYLGFTVNSKLQSQQHINTISSAVQTGCWDS